MNRSTARLPRAERREQIAGAALEIIGTRGLASLSTATLAEAVGLTSGALFRHFASLEEILEEAVRQAEAAIDATCPDASLPARERLRQLALARIRLLSEQPGIAWLLRSDQARLALSPTAVEVLRLVVRRSRTYIRRAVRDAVAAGDVRDDVPVDVLLLVYTSTVHALVAKPGASTTRPSARWARTLEGLLTMLAPTTSPDARS